MGLMCLWEWTSTSRKLGHKGSHQVVTTHQAPATDWKPQIHPSQTRPLTPPAVASPHPHDGGLLLQSWPQTYLLCDDPGIRQIHSGPSVLPSPVSLNPSPHLARPEVSPGAFSPHPATFAAVPGCPSSGITQPPKPQRRLSLPTPLPRARRSAPSNRRRASHCAGGPADPAARPRWVRTFQPAELLLSPLSLK